MRITKQLKYELIRAVLLDQFKTRVETNKKALQAKVDAFVTKRDAGAYAEMRAVAEKHSMDKSIVRHITEVNYDIKHEGEVYIDRPNNYPECVFRISYKIVPKVLGIFNGTYSTYRSEVQFKASQKELGVEKVIADGFKITEDMTQMQADLNSVLSSVSTVKKLQELTKVFDPFLPSDVSGMALIPTEAVLRVNELKSPKHKRKA